MSESTTFPPVDFATAFNAFDNLGSTIEGSQAEMHFWQDVCRFCLEQIPPHRITKVLNRTNEILRPRLTTKGEECETSEAFDLIAALVEKGAPNISGPTSWLSQVRLADYRKLVDREHGQGAPLTSEEETRLQKYRTLAAMMED